MNMYRASLDYIYSLTDYEKQSGFVYSPDRFDLGRVHRLLDLLGNPHQRFPSVHIAGTKGKGSTSALTASILQRASFRTGLYTSPHLHTFRERIQIDSSLISESEVVQGVERLRQVAPLVPQITTFELITALGLDYFARQQVDIAVIEVGMGGRLDATNVITPLVSAITSISLDHTQYLGRTVAEIAAEKAGIIKPGIPVISAPQEPAAQAVIERIAAEQNARLICLGRDWHWQSERVSPDGQTFSAWPASWPGQAVTYNLPLLGRHQQVNATLVLALVDVLQKQGLFISEQAIHEGLAVVCWPGRLQVLSRQPWLIVDGAHNGDSMHKLRLSLAELFPHQKLILILGVSADKDLDAILDAILPAASCVLVTQSHHPRAASTDELVRRIAARQVAVRAVDIQDVLSTALALTDEQDLILATGSLFLVADVIAAWRQYDHQPSPPTDAE